MVFDLISFLAGILAGGLIGGLASILHGLEGTADMQESLLKIRREVDRIDPKLSLGQPDPETPAKMKELHEQLDAINAEIRRMYQKASR